MPFLPKFLRPYTIRNVEWSSEDSPDMKSLIQNPYFKTMWKLLDRRIDQRKEELVNGQDTRSRIDEIKDLIYELQSYDSPRA
jgi:hypothetical protein